MEIRGLSSISHEVFYGTEIKFQVMKLFPAMIFTLILRNVFYFCNKSVILAIFILFLLSGTEIFWERLNLVQEN